MGWQDRGYNQDGGGSIPPVQFRLPPITPVAKGLLIACGAIFLLQMATRPSGAIEYWGSLTFIGGRGWIQPWRFITYQYLHGGVLHLFFNMLGVYFFMPTLEARWGPRKALGFYTVGGIVAGLFFWAFSLFNGGGALIGASGSVLAILGAVALYYPDRQLILLIFPVRIRVAAALLGVVFLLTAVSEGDLSNAAHLGGLAFGFFAPWLAGPLLVDASKKFRQIRQDQADKAVVAEEREIDRILAKVADSGMISLTAGEKRTLTSATENQLKRDRRTGGNYRR